MTDLQKVSGATKVGDLDTNAESSEENTTVLDQIRQILRKQIDTLAWLDKQSGKFFL